MSRAVEAQGPQRKRDVRVCGRSLSCWRVPKQVEATDRRDGIEPSQPLRRSMAPPWDQVDPASSVGDLDGVRRSACEEPTELPPRVRPFRCYGKRRGRRMDLPARRARGSDFVPRSPRASVLVTCSYQMRSLRSSLASGSTSSRATRVSTPRPRSSATRGDAGCVQTGRDTPASWRNTECCRHRCSARRPSGDRALVSAETSQAEPIYPPQPAGGTGLSCDAEARRGRPHEIPDHVLPGSPTVHLTPTRPRSIRAITAPS